MKPPGELLSPLLPPPKFSSIRAFSSTITIYLYRSVDERNCNQVFTRMHACIEAEGLVNELWFKNKLINK
jgi:hypothetical protein